MSSIPRLVSVVIPCWNAGPKLRPALGSVIEQTYPNLEIIFVDNNSSDRSRQLAQEIAQTTTRPFRITACEAQGVNNARNWGYRFARGEFIQWMDADDTLDADKIALQVAALDQNPSDDIAYGDWTAHQTEPGKPQFVRLQKLKQIKDQVLRTLALTWYPPHLYLFRSRAAQLLQNVQAWWPERKVATDVEYSALAALLGLRFRYVAGAHVHYNVWSPDQISGRTPYKDRVAALVAIFARLRDFAHSPQCQVKLTPQHKILLEQSWGVWRLSRHAVTLIKLPGRRVLLRHVGSGKEIEMRPREAAIARALMAVSQPLTACHYAGILTELPNVSDDHVLVVQTIDHLRREGFLEEVTA